MPGVATTTTPALPVASVVATSLTRNATAKYPIDTRLNNYLVSHNSASLNGVPGALPSYVRLVGYQTNR